MPLDYDLAGLPAADPLATGDLLLVEQEGDAKRTTLGAVRDNVLAAADFQEEASETDAALGVSDSVVMTPRRTKAVVEAAVDALETDVTTALSGKAPTSRTITGAGLVTGGGDLSSNRTLTVTEASEAEALAGVDAASVMTPRRAKAVVDAAVDALETDVTTALSGKAPTSRTITGAGLVTGGGDLSSDRTLTVTEASEAEALAGVDAATVMTPRRTKASVDAAIDALETDVTTALDGKAPTSRAITGGGLVSGGGDLSSDRTLTVAEASEAEALAGLDAATVMTPRRSKAVVDAAIDALEADVTTALSGKAPTSRTITGGGLVSGGGDLSSNRTLTVTEASEAEALAGASATTVMTPRRSKTLVEAAAAVLQDSIDDLATAQASAAAAIETLLPSTSYSNPGGAGDRTASITVTASASLLNEGVASNLVDGGVAPGGADCVAFKAGSPAGAFLRFDFGPGAAQRISEARWRQTNTSTHGTWQWRASDDLVSYVNIGSSFILGGATQQLQTELASNSAGYRYYELLGVSGALGVTPYIQEIEFKIAPTTLDQRLFAPKEGAAGEVLTKLSDTSGDYAFQPGRRVYPMPATGLLAEWYFDEGDGDRVRNMRSGDGARDIVFDETFRSTYNSSPEWTRKGLLLAGDMVETATAIPGVRTVATLYRLKRGDGGFVLSGGAGANFGILGGSVSPSYEHWVANGSGIAPLLRDTGGGLTWRLNRGGWLLIFTEFDTGYNTRLGWGGKHSDGGPTYRSSQMELAWSACWSGQLDADDRQAVFRSVRRLAGERDIYLHWRDCPDYYDCALFWGQSGITGFSIIDGYSETGDLSDAEQARTTPTSSVLISHAPGTAGPAALSGIWPMLEPFQFKTNHVTHGLLQTRMGPLPGAAWAHEDNRANRQRKLAINIAAVESSSLATTNAEGAIPPEFTWNVAANKTHGLLWMAMRHWWEIEQRLLLQGIGPRLRTLWYFQGETDGIDTVQSAAYGANLADLWDTTKFYLGTGPDFTMKLVKSPYGTPLSGISVEANAEVRAAQVAFAAAEPDVELIEGDDLEQQTEGSLADEHWTAQGVKTIGERLYAATDLS